MTDHDALYAGLLARLREIAHLNAAKNALEWDMETYMPPGAADQRASALACLAGLAHAKAVSPEFEDVLAPLAALEEDGRLDPADASGPIIRKAWRDFQRNKKLPGAFVEEFEALTASSHHVWVDARKASDWSRFEPNLVRIVAMSREEARLVGYAASPYDALLDEYEPGMTAAKTAALLGAVAPRLSRLVGAIVASGAAEASVKVPAPLEYQRAYNARVAAALGFDLATGRLDESAHPFTATLHASDVRLTTRYDESDLLYGLYSTIHEAGHGMYEQGLPAELYGTSAYDVPSLGIHESQSRLWENLVGRSRPFCAWLRRTMAEGLAAVPSVDELFRTVNAAAPSLIRTEADEVTYNLHICIRFEIERALIEGTLEPSGVPAAWNAKMREYLGIDVPDDARGALQDVHWSAGLFGYFPTYAIGNLYSAQLFDAAVADLGPLDERHARGEFAPLLGWLRERVHRHGGRKEAAAIVRDACRAEPDAKHFLEYVERKYGELYAL